MANLKYQWIKPTTKENNMLGDVLKHKQQMSANCFVKLDGEQGRRKKHNKQGISEKRNRNGKYNVKTVLHF